MQRKVKQSKKVLGKNITKGKNLFCPVPNEDTVVRLAEQHKQGHKLTRHKLMVASTVLTVWEW